MDNQLRDDQVAEEENGNAEAAIPSGKPVGHDGARVDISERPASSRGGAVAFLVLLGYIVLFALIVVFFGTSISMADAAEGAGEATPALAIAGIIVGAVGMGLLIPVMLTSFTIVPPGQTSVRSFFGRYIGTVRRTGLSVVAPLTTGKRTSVRVRNFETNTIKVNDLEGNPINIAAIVVWQVSDTARAQFAVEKYEEFVSTQAEAALRHVAGTHPYDNGPAGTLSLLGSTDIVSAELAHEVAERVALAGVEVVEVRISALAYAPEIAQAMLQRQQASSVIAARERIVEGAVSMVDDALKRLESQGIVELDDERRAQMVSNLLVVLCSESHATPVVNTGSLYS